MEPRLAAPDPMLAPCLASYGQASPGFPWTCILNQNNDLQAAAPSSPTTSATTTTPDQKVITAAHKLKNIATNDLLKVRVGEWDASGFNARSSRVTRSTQWSGSSSIPPCP